jgi:hypothetical protein
VRDQASVAAAIAGADAVVRLSHVWSNERA